MLQFSDMNLNYVAWEKESKNGINTTKTGENPESNNF